ncbi:MAG: site-2 protease family protein [Verrucomicrobia bacterium]|nr:site-2 protease family protein [Verrucomicrobiota bacterium]
MTTVRGVPIKIHVTAFFLLPWVYGAMEKMDMPPAWRLWITLLFITLLLTSVALHELGHMLVAQRYHMRAQDIILTPVGGVLRLRGDVENPRHEIRIALAGPYVSLVLALSGLLLSRLFYASGWEIAGAAFYIFTYMNGLLFFFNLLPSFPMDGGRVLRGVLAQKKGMLEATRIAAGLGKSIAIVLLVIGFTTKGINFIIIGFFLLWVAGSEYRMMRLKAMQEQMFGGAAIGANAAAGDLNHVEVSPPPYASENKKSAKADLSGFWGDVVMTARDLFEETFSSSKR